MMLIIFLLWQADTPKPDIELNASVHALSVTIEKHGNARLSVSTSPEGHNVVDVRAPQANGRKTLSNVQVDVRAETRIADLAQGANNNDEAGETDSPQ